MPQPGDPPNATHLLIDRLQWNGTTPSGWIYCFAQTASVYMSFTLPAADGNGNQAGTYVNSPPKAGLDDGFPAFGITLPPQPVPPEADDPGVIIYHGGKKKSDLLGVSEYFILATTYYMCEPVVNGVAIGGWVPLAKLIGHIGSWKDGTRGTTIRRKSTRWAGSLEMFGPTYRSSRRPTFIIRLTAFRPRRPFPVERCPPDARGECSPPACNVHHVICR